MKKSTRNIGIVVIVIILIAAVASSHPNTPLSGVQPGAEGLQLVNDGFQGGNSQTITAVNAAIPDSGSYTYSWLSGSAILSAGVTKTGPGSCSTLTCYGTGTFSGNFDDQIQIPQTQTTTLLGNVAGSSSSQTIDYNVMVNSTAHQHIVGNVVIETTTIEFKGGGSGFQQFNDEAQWFKLYTNVWSVQECDPTNQTACQNGYVWAAPLEAVITGVQQIGCDISTFNCDQSTGATPSDDQMNPMSQGASLSLYTGVGNSVPVSTLGVGNGGVQQSLQSGGSPVAPDSSMSEYTYFPVSFVNFGAYPCGIGGTATCYPDVTLTVEVYYLVIGSFLWNNPNTTKYVPTPSCSSFTCSSFIATISAWLSNPFDIAGLSIFVLVALAIVVFIVAVVIIGRVPSFSHGSKNT